MVFTTGSQPDKVAAVNLSGVATCVIDFRPRLEQKGKMEPSYLSTDIWHDLSTLLRLMWVFIFLVVGVAGNFLIAHAIIPSLAASHQLPRWIVRTRPLFYLQALTALALTMAVAVLAILNADIAQRIFPRWWI